MTIREILHIAGKPVHSVRMISTGDIIVLNSPDWSGVWGKNQTTGKYSIHNYDRDDYEIVETTKSPI
jgi:hypothetical protein